MLVDWSWWCGGNRFLVFARTRVVAANARTRARRGGDACERRPVARERGPYTVVICAKCIYIWDLPLCFLFFYFFFIFLFFFFIRIQTRYVSFPHFKFVVLFLQREYRVRDDSDKKYIFLFRLKKRNIYIYIYINIYKIYIYIYWHVNIIISESISYLFYKKTTITTALDEIISQIDYTYKIILQWLQVMKRRVFTMQCFIVFSCLSNNILNVLL